VHYLRTSNPQNPEMLSVYAKRLSTNRTNAYPLPGDSLLLKDGMNSYETRHCAGQPTQVPFDLGPTINGVLSDALRSNVLKFALGDGQVAAPPCKQQQRFNFNGTLTQFPQLRESIQGVQAGAPAP
jgi:hypothetical protein